MSKCKDCKWWENDRGDWTATGWTATGWTGSHNDRGFCNLLPVKIDKKGNNPSCSKFEGTGNGEK